MGLAMKACAQNTHLAPLRGGQGLHTAEALCQEPVREADTSLKTPSQPHLLACADSVSCMLLHISDLLLPFPSIAQNLQ